ncbi:MAG: hypothetical protein R3B89_29190 [Polyangiaceae bacterium]
MSASLADPLLDEDRWIFPTVFQAGRGALWCYRQGTQAAEGRAGELTRRSGERSLNLIAQALRSYLVGWQSRSG